jgi:ABC-type sugar transport system substrate-binding protein
VGVAAVVAAGLAVGAEPVRVRELGARPVPLRIGVVLKGLDNPFFLAIYEGARAEAARLDVRATVRSVSTSADIRGQVARVRSAVAEGADCYVINPITGTNVTPGLRGVRRPIVNVDSPIDKAAAERAGVRITTYIGTDDFAAGRLAGTQMVSLLPGGGDVALVGGLPHNFNGDMRLSGFERGIRGSPVRVVARVYADFDRTQAEIEAERILRAHPRVSGFFAANDLMALGIADALRSGGRTGTVPIIGLDGNAEALGAIRAGSMSATVSQYPYVMGRLAVDACAAAARGAKLPARVDAPIALLTRDNVDQAIAAFPRPVRPYPDPLQELLRATRRP